MKRFSVGLVAVLALGLGLLVANEAPAAPKGTLTIGIPTDINTLDPTMGGPSFQDFVIDKPEHSPHYEYPLHDPDDPKAQRRSIYRFLVRSQPQPFMAALDCADPSMQVATRNESVTALQSLALLNNALVISLSKHFAARLESEPGSIGEKTNRAFYSAIGRAPTDEDAEQLTRFAEEHGLENLCRALFNLNEFAFVD